MTTHEHRTRDAEWEIVVITVAIAAAVVMMAIAEVAKWTAGVRLRETAPDGATTNVSSASPRLREIAPAGATTNVSSAPPRRCGKTAVMRTIGTCEFCGMSGAALANACQGEKP
jgi:hypothetical protein